MPTAAAQQTAWPMLRVCSLPECSLFLAACGLGEGGGRALEVGEEVGMRRRGVGGRGGGGGFRQELVCMFSLQQKMLCC